MLHDDGVQLYATFRDGSPARPFFPRPWYSSIPPPRVTGMDGRAIEMAMDLDEESIPSLTIPL